MEYYWLGLISPIFEMYPDHHSHYHQTDYYQYCKTYGLDNFTEFGSAFFIHWIGGFLFQYRAQPVTDRPNL